MCPPAQVGGVADAGVVGAKSPALNEPRCVRPSWKALLRQARTNALEEAERKLVLWDLGLLRIPPCFDASMFLTSHALIGRPYALRGNYLSRITSAGRSLARKRPCDDGPPLEPIPNWEDRMPARPVPSAGSLRSSLPL